MKAKIPGNLLTTAMAVMPHKDAERALEVALSMDVPFWPQLPNYSYYEDMYVQAAEHFPGILLDVDNRTLRFSTEKFIMELEDALGHLLMTARKKERPPDRNRQRLPALKSRGASLGFNTAKAC